MENPYFQLPPRLEVEPEFCFWDVEELVTQAQQLLEDLDDVLERLRKIAPVAGVSLDDPEMISIRHHLMKQVYGIHTSICIGRSISFDEASDTEEEQGILIKKIEEDKLERYFRQATRAIQDTFPIIKPENPTETE